MGALLPHGCSTTVWFPLLFITISSYEWTFPFLQWLQNICRQTGCSPTTLPAHETLHIAHVLEMRGGERIPLWQQQQQMEQHVFSYNGVACKKNVNTYFCRYHFEFSRMMNSAHAFTCVVKEHCINWIPPCSRRLPQDQSDLAYYVCKY